MSSKLKKKLKKTSMVFTRVFSLEYWGKRKLCLVSCHGCHIHGTWRTKEVRLGEGGGGGEF